MPVVLRCVVLGLAVCCVVVTVVLRCAVVLLFATVSA